MTISQYLDKLNRLYKTGLSREHSYRGDLQNLLMAILPDILATNEPARIACGAPDYVLTRKDVPIGYIEAKDIGVDLSSKSLKEQFDRYKAGLSNLIFTDYLDFHFYKEGVLTTSVSLASIEHGSIVPKPENFDRFTDLIHNFAQTITQTIKSPTKLAEMMAGKAKLMANVIEQSLNVDDENNTRSALKAQMTSFQQMLIHDITNSGFADIYAQTIAYGMFAARYHDPTLPTFSRQEAATLIPKSNPFLRKLFQDIAGYDLDERLVWIVEELVNIFLASDVADIMRNFGKSTKQEDPVVHFYETFLAAYNPALRKARGVWYTPQPIVNFIVRAVDDILKTEFNLPQGLADTSKIKVKVDVQGKKVEQEVHKVQILDPATGTGTFLAETVRHIYKNFEGQQGIWSNYVNQHLIPRLNGFELLMASYAMAHLKLDILLTETGYSPSLPERAGVGQQRFRIFLTNSLEEAHPDTQTLFSSWLSDEADQANAVKKDTPVMVIMGNPPYSVSSSNKSEWIEKLTADYKRDLKERNIQPLSDDYIKFIRFGQYFINKNGTGILAYITNSGFLDGLIHRQMRKNLLENFDKIYILDLHGNARKKETSPDGTPDQNVFDIMAGVSITLLVKTGKKRTNELASTFFHELYGKREYKYQALINGSISTIDWTPLTANQPNWFFINKDFEGKEEYELGFKLDDLFLESNAGFATEFDELAINHSQTLAETLLNDLMTLKVTEIVSKYKLPSKKIDKVERAKSDVLKNKSTIMRIDYRPFDPKYIIYTGVANGIIGRPRNGIMKHLVRDNIALLTCRQQTSFDFQHIFISKLMSERCSVSLQTGEVNYVFPLYLYPDNMGQQTIGAQIEKIPNLNESIVTEIANAAGMWYSPQEPEQGSTIEDNTFFPIDLLDYIYAVLHSPSYREKYKEFLKIDFPRVPYPTDPKQFFDLVDLGNQLRDVHLMESKKSGKLITQYPVDGDNVVGKVRFELTPEPGGHPEPVEGQTNKAQNQTGGSATNAEIATPAKGQARNDVSTGRVYINETQYFDKVPKAAWEFYIGGYQPAQKWLKDRKGRELSYEDILHYQKIIVALTETGRLMREVDRVWERA